MKSDPGHFASSPDHILFILELFNDIPRDTNAVILHKEMQHIFFHIPININVENTLPTAVITVKNCIFHDGLKDKFDRLHPIDFFVHINIQTHMVPIPEILDIYIVFNIFQLFFDISLFPISSKAISQQISKSVNTLNNIVRAPDYSHPPDGSQRIKQEVRVNLCSKGFVSVPLLNFLLYFQTSKSLL